MTTAPGRPRDRRIDRAVLAATAELLVEVGYADLTIAAVAERARTTKPAIYRRWRSKAHLVHEAAFPTDAERVQVPSTGALDTDLRAMV
ncbi:helix-turn-helix domain-containing protein, partial [Nocardioides hankookensis]